MPIFLPRFFRSILAPSCFGLGLALLFSLSPGAGAAESQPKELGNVGIQPELGAQVPLESLVRDESGAVVESQIPGYVIVLAPTATATSTA